MLIRVTADGSIKNEIAAIIDYQTLYEGESTFVDLFRHFAYCLLCGIRQYIDCLGGLNVKSFNVDQLGRLSL